MSSEKKQIGILPQEIFHPSDIKYLEKLKAIPGLESLISNTVAELREKYMTVNLRGSGIDVNDHSYSQLYEHLKKTAKAIGMSDVPGMSVLWEYDIHMATEGVKHPRLVLLSGAVDLLDDDELTFLMAHELGHLACGHQPYRILTITLYTSLLELVPMGKQALMVVRPMALNWYRLSDYTADRVGLLACGSIDVALRTMVKMSGIPKKYFDNINIAAFIKQAEQFERDSSGVMDKLIANMSRNASSAPWLVSRAAELFKWSNSQEFTSLKEKFEQSKQR